MQTKVKTSQELIDYFLGNKYIIWTTFKFVFPLLLNHFSIVTFLWVP